MGVRADPRCRMRRREGKKQETHIAPVDPAGGQAGKPDTFARGNLAISTKPVNVGGHGADVVLVGCCEHSAEEAWRVNVSGVFTRWWTGNHGYVG
jgi:hypothetical protein